MKLRLTVSFLVVAVLVAADALLAVWAIQFARELFPGSLEPLAISVVSVAALGLGGVIVTAGQSLLAAWLCDGLPDKAELF